MSSELVNIAYLVAASLFIFGLKGLSHPRTAVRGNLLGAIGMLIAILVTLLNKQIISYELIIVGFILGGAIGAVLAIRIQMTAVPQLVALFNGFGGGASVLVAGAAYIETVSSTPNAGLTTHLSSQFTSAIAASCLESSLHLLTQGLSCLEPLQWQLQHRFPKLLGSSFSSALCKSFHPFL